jgi:Uma2 family endonuclease
MPIVIPEVIEFHPEPPSDLIANDGVPMEDGWHRSQMNLLIDSIQYHWRDRTDFFAGGNMFIYYSRKKVFNKDFRGPDFFVVKDCEWNPDRLYWATWDEEGKYPNVIVELISSTTADVDRGDKKNLFATTFHTPEYYCYDRHEPLLEGFFLKGRQYTSKKPKNDRIWSPELDAYLGIWEGEFQLIETNWLRLFDADGNLIPTRAEAEAAQAAEANRRATREKARADEARIRADEADTRAEAANARAEEATARADALAAELEKLKAELNKPKRNGSSK